MPKSPPRNIAIVQYSGDFREATERLAQGGKENYRAQRYTVDFVHGLAGRHGSVTTITGFTNEAHDVVLPSGVRAIGAGFQGSWNTRTMIELIDRVRPDRIILRTPRIALLRSIARSRIPTLAMLADSLPRRTFKDRIKRALTVRYLNAPFIERIGNHGANAAGQLLEAGVRPEKVAAWDYPPLDTPHDRLPKEAAIGRLVLYVGMLTADKGVDDALGAAAALRRQGAPVTLELIGDGDVERVRTLAQTLGIGSDLRLRGRVPNDRIIDAMRAADVVIVPSRHAYPEGLPLTIYEAFCSRTPLVVSDHPMFAGNVVHEESGMVFPAGDAGALAQSIARVLDEPALYGTLSAASAPAWQRLQIPNTWGRMIDAWLDEA